MNWTKNLPGSCYCPRHIKVLILAVNFTKLFKLGHDLSPLPFERQIKLRGKTGSAIFSITQPKISQMLPNTENTWGLSIFQNGLLEQLKRIKKKLKPNCSPKCCQSIADPFSKLEPTSRSINTMLSIYNNTTSSSPHPSSFYETRVTHWVARVANYKTQPW